MGCMPGFSCLKRKKKMGTPSSQDKLMEEAASILAKSRGLSQRIATYCNRLTGESDSLAVEVKSLQQAIASAEKAAMAHPDAIAASDALADLRTAKEVITGLGPGGDLRKFCKPKHPMMLRLLLGDKVSVVAYRADQACAMKEEYHSFRDRAALVMLLVPALLVLGMRRADAVRAAQGQGAGEHTFTPGLMTGVQLYFLWLGYFYLALAMRENVLMVNGSAIKSWWIQHHYWSAGCAAMLLGLPVYSPSFYTFCKYFLTWSCAQALVMMVQNHYQRKRMYTRIALGKDRAMDVVAGESTGTSGQLLLLYPMLFALQAAQFAIGAGVAWRTAPAMFASEGWLDVEADPASSDLRGMRGVFVVGGVFCFMALRNAQVTVQTVLEKRRYATRMRKSRSKGQGLSAQGQEAAAAGKEKSK